MKKDDGEIRELSQFAEECVRRAGEEALSYYGRGKCEMKFDEGLVTEAELGLRAYFQEQLDSTFPEHQLYRNLEETRAYSHEEKRYLWIYDPLDGVANFQAGIPVWGVSLALLENYWPILGFFYMPVAGDLFCAQGGDRAYWGNLEMRVPKERDISDESLLLTYSRFHRQYTSSFPGKIRNLGCTTAHICYVAAGRAEAAIVSRETYQGLATGRAIIEAAGGKIYKMDGAEFFLNEYLDGQRISDDLLVVSPGMFSLIRPHVFGLP